ncbi:MAG: hypothetical protein V4557_17195 [Bacteroidota bacterium]
MDKKYRGMTVNERLWVSGYWDEFEQAIEKKDLQKIINILKEVELTEDNIVPIIENLGLKYE